VPNAMTRTAVPGIYRRGSSYTYVVSLGRDPKTGRRRQRWVGGFRTIAEARAARAAEASAPQKNGSELRGEPTLSSFVEESWLPAQAVRVRPGTLNLYRINWERVKPRLGAVPLRAIEPLALQALYGELLERGGRGGRPLGGRSVQIVHAFVHRCLGDAVRRGMLEKNPASLADRPSARRPEIRAWSPEQIGRFLEFTNTHRLAPLWRLVAMTGLRRGEALGLYWSDVDLDQARIAVRRSLVLVGNRPVLGEPKSVRGRRTIDLDPETTAQLRRWRGRVLSELGPASLGGEDGAAPVFVGAEGAALHPANVSRTFAGLVAGTGLPTIGLHGLRHSHATAMLASGISPKIAQERLGHFSVTLTLDTYSHALPGMQREAAVTVASLVDRSTKLAKSNHTW